MKSLVAAVVAGALVGSGFASGSVEQARGHEPGVVHPHPDDASHAHGDADDHHESPDSPCHHHDVHSCADAGPTLGLLPESTPMIARVSTRFVAAESARFHEPSIRTSFHVPLA